MARILIVYATTEGQTQKIADRMGDWARTRGHSVCVLDSALAGAVRVDGFDAYIVAGSLHLRKHQRCLADFVRSNRTVLNRAPSAFVSVSATGSRTDAKSIDEAQACIDDFLASTAWKPAATEPIGGAIQYTKYNWLLRMIMKRISKQNHGPTDTSRDHELTDWPRLESFVDTFLASLAPVDGLLKVPA